MQLWWASLWGGEPWQRIGAWLMVLVVGTMVCDLCL